MAAALGKVAIVAQLKSLSYVDIIDEDGRTPLAWAAETHHLEVVNYLVFEASADVVACRRLPPIDVARSAYHDPTRSLNLLTILVDQDAPDGFWNYFGNEPHEALKPCLSRSSISQALFAASCKGHTNVVKQLVQLGADSAHYSRFAWPGHPNGLQGWPVLVNLESAGVDAVITFVAAFDSLQSPPSDLADALVSRIFTLATHDAARLTPLLSECGVSCLSYNIIANVVCLTPGVFTTERRSLLRPVIRSMLHFAISSRLHLRELTCWQLILSFWEYAGDKGFLQAWIEAVPDDVLTMLMETGVSDRELPKPKNCNEIVQALSCRMSSRALAAFLHIWLDTRLPSSWNSLGSIKRGVVAHAQTIGNREALEFIIYHGSEAMADPHLRRQYVLKHTDQKYILRMPNLPSDAIVEHLRKGLSDPSVAYYLCFRALRYCEQDARKATQFIEDLKGINKELDLSLNFPAGYWRVGKRYAVKLSIVGSIYRWNWKLRRHKGLPLSDADIAYAKAVPECLQELLMPAFFQQRDDEHVWRNMQCDISGPIRFKNTKQQDAIADMIRVIGFKYSRNRWRHEGS